MTEVVHLRCDRCEVDVISDAMTAPKGWARIMVDLHLLHYCPVCWQKMLTPAKEAQ